MGLTQERLAEIAELSPTFIAKLEAGVKTPSLDTIVELSAALGIDPAELIGGCTQDERDEHARNLARALDGLSDEDVEFVEQELFRLAAYLRRRST